jgi:hypothetical protein
MNNLLKPIKIQQYIKNHIIRIIKNKQQFVQEYPEKPTFDALMFKIMKDMEQIGITFKLETDKDIQVEGRPREFNLKNELLNRKS